MNAPPKRNATWARGGASGNSDDDKLEPLLDATPSMPNQDLAPRLGGTDRAYLHTRGQAEQLASKIRSFWKAKGLDVEVWCVQDARGDWITRSKISLAVRP